VTDLDLTALQDWLEASLSGPRAPLSVQPVPGGASNRIFRLNYRGHDYALRLPPARRNDRSADTILRELRLLQALGHSAIPHPRLIASSDDASILGAPFALMDWIDGFSPRAPLPEEFATQYSRRRLSEELIDGLVKVSTADWRGIGLENFGKPDGFLERQANRWQGQLQRATTRELPHLAAVCDWLQVNVPAMQRAALIHGDYTFINVMFAPDPPPRLVAIVDWESATIGDPLLDLGWLLACWQEPGEMPSHASYFEWTQMPPRAAMARRYAHATGLDVETLPFYMALSLLKLAAIMEGWYSLYRSGQSTHPSHAAMEQGVPHMLARAAMFAGVDLAWLA
jgi:aminoglycoside phosphotransferase (APT) family kinase protein